ncbi:MAG: hypothetical protein ACOX8M_10020 [Marvinbryantia sp.]
MRNKKWRGFLLACVMIGSVILGGGEAVKVQASGVEEAWADTFGARAVVEGTQVSFGPITMEMPENFIIEDKSAAEPTFYNVDRLTDDVIPMITFSMNSFTAVTSDSGENQRAFEEALSKNLGEQGISLDEIKSYEETELEAYKVIRGEYLCSTGGVQLFCKAYEIYEKLDEMGNSVLIEYYGKAEDTESQQAAETAFNTIGLLTGSYEKGSLVSMVSPWEMQFNVQNEVNGTQISFDGTTVTYGPLQMELPAGYTQSTNEGEDTMFYAPDGSENFSFSYENDSFYLYKDVETMENLLQQSYAQNGFTVDVTDSQIMDVSGYNAVLATAIVSSPEVSMQQNIVLIFEDVDELMSPVITIYHTGDGSEESVLSTVDAWNSMRITE